MLTYLPTDETNLRIIKNNKKKKDIILVIIHVGMAGYFELHTFYGRCGRFESGI